MRTQIFHLLGRLRAISPSSSVVVDQVTPQQQVGERGASDQVSGPLPVAKPVLLHIAGQQVRLGW
jgi:hypothetical protein